MKTLFIFLTLFSSFVFAKTVEAPRGLTLKEKNHKEYLEITGQGKVEDQKPVEIKVEANLDKSRLEKGQVLGFIKEEESSQILVLRYEKNNLFRSYQGTIPKGPAPGKDLQVVLQVPIK